MRRNDPTMSGREEPPMVQSSTALPLLRGVPIPMTWDEFIAWDVEGKTEWVDGEGIAHVSSSARHVQIVIFLSELIGRYLRLFDLGVVFAESMIVRLPSRPSGRAPDVFVVGQADRERVRPKWVDGPVPLAIELISEDSVARDTVEKRAEYEREGIHEYLIIEARPERNGLTFLRLGADGQYAPVLPDENSRYHSMVLPGFWIDPAWFERDSLPEVDRLMLQIAPAAYRRYLAELLAE
jgi:Uma2 family endonuclease